MGVINIEQVTTTLTNGAGVFDVLMRSIDSHLDKQYTSGRIKGADYATVYLGAIQTTLAQAIAFVLQEQKAEKELDLLDAELVLKEKMVEVQTEQIAASQAATAVKEQLADAQEAVYNRQVTSFSEDYKFKVGKSMLDLRTTGMTQGLAGLTDESGEAIGTELLSSAGYTATLDLTSIV